MDDDIILHQRNTMEKIFELSKLGNYGCSALRYWSKEGWYQKNYKELIKKIKRGDQDYKIPLCYPDPRVRKKNNNKHLIRSYIGNFGFIKKTALEKVGMWDETYKGYGIEDDDMLFKLYINYGRPVLLDSILVIHIWHRINQNNFEELDKNKRKFKRKLESFSIKKFHSGALLYNEEEVLEYDI